MDASSDVEKDQQGRIDQIGSRKGLKFTRRHPDATPYAQIFDGNSCERPETVVDSYGKTVPNPPAPIVRQESAMVYMPLLKNERPFQVLTRQDPSFRVHTTLSGPPIR